MPSPKKVLRKIQEKIFINKKFTQCKTSRTLKIDVFEIPDNKILENCFQNMNCFSWIKLIPVLIHLKYWYYDSPHLELYCLAHHLCRILLKPIDTSLQHNTYHVLHRFPYFALPHSTTRCHKYWIYQTMCQDKPIKCIIKLYTYHNILLVNSATHEKAESLWANSLSKLDNTVNNKSIFNTRYAGFSAKW